MIYSTFHFANASGSATITVAANAEEWLAVDLYRGRVDLFTAFPEAVDYEDEDDEVEGLDDVEFTEDTDWSDEE